MSEKFGSIEEALAALANPGTPAWAEAFAKVGFVRAPDAARALWERHDLAAMVVTEDGRCEPTATWARFDPTEAWA